MRKGGLRSGDVAPPEDGEPAHWMVRHRHRRHVARMIAGGGLGSPPMPESAERTRFQKAVVHVSMEKNVTKCGSHSSKIGKRITKTHWKGRNIRTVTLEERATCPRACENWTTCYGNAMPFARRLIHGPQLERELVLEVTQSFSSGVALRLHQLGDFYSPAYVDLWTDLVSRLDVVAFGYTAHPADSPIGKKIAIAAAAMWDRFAVRFSGAYQPKSVRRALTVQSHEEAEAAGAVVCPAQLGKTASCATCGLCWTAEKPIAFLQH